MNHPKLQPVYTITVIVITIIQRINWVGKNQSSHAATFKNKVIAFLSKSINVAFNFLPTSFIRICIYLVNLVDDY